MEIENAGINALLFRERTLNPTHSDVIVGLLRQSIEQYQIFRSPRSESHLTVQMAEELKSAQKYEEALHLLRPVIVQYRQDKWNALLNAVLLLALKCAFLVGSISDYLAFSIELANIPAVSNKVLRAKGGRGDQVEKADANRIMKNICALFDSTSEGGAKIPCTEPGLNSKVERAAVGRAMQIWNDSLQKFVTTEEEMPPIDVNLNEHVTKSNVLKISVYFECDKFQADEKIKINCCVKNSAAPTKTDCLLDDSKTPYENKNDFVLPVCGIQLCLAFNKESPLQPGSVSNAEDKNCEDGEPDINLKWEPHDQDSSHDGVVMLAAGTSLLRTFEFQPKSTNVGKYVTVQKIVIKLGRQNDASKNKEGEYKGGHFKANLHFFLPKSLSTTELDDSANKKAEFFPLSSPISSAWVQNETDVTADETDSHQVQRGLSFSLANIVQREPKLKMKLVGNGPILVGEWFPVHVDLNNQEGVVDSLTDVVVSARLIDAGNPLIADTTRLVMDYKILDDKGAQTPVTPITPGGSEVIKEFSFASPPVVKVISGGIAKNSSKRITFFLRASTTGQRGVEVSAKYKVLHFECEVRDDIEMDSISPFEMGSELLSCKRQLPLENAFTDEPFLFLPEIKSLSHHSVKIIDSWLEVKHPVQICGEKKIPSQLAGCVLYKDSIGNECYPLIAKRENLVVNNLGK